MARAGAYRSASAVRRGSRSALPVLPLGYHQVR
jgi:hypothetical protein